jgi:hypothetical protein
MSGHKADRNNIPRRKPEPNATSMTSALDQLAADATSKRQGGDPVIAELEPALTSLHAEFQRLCGHLDDVTAGAALMVVGQLAAINLRDQPDDQKVDAAMRVPMLTLLLGAQLYTGSAHGVEVTCPFTYLTGVPCGKTIVSATHSHAELLMRGHVWQHHPGETWPPVDVEEADVDAVNLAPTDPAVQAAAIADLEAEFPDKNELAELADRASQTGQCPDCSQWVYLEDDGRIGFHPVGEDGNQRTCPGAGCEPKADGGAEG